MTLAEGPAPRPSLQRRGLTRRDVERAAQAAFGIGPRGCRRRLARGL